MNDTDHNAVDTAATRARLDRLAWFLDGCIPLPGTRYKVGIEPIIGLVPVLGDVVGLGLGSMILYESVRIGAPRKLLLKMVGNAGADALLGAVPVLGDAFDFAFKSNRRNARLLIEYLDHLESAERRALREHRGLSALLVIAAMGLVVAAVAWGLLRVL